jgi:hypothetical protein
MYSENTWLHFAAATVTLVGSGPIKDRLFAAYRNELAELDIDLLPGELRSDYLRWHASLHRERPLRGEDAVRATLRKLSGQEADRLAQAFVRISLRLLRIAPPNKIDLPDLRAQSSATGSVVQLFPG